MTTDDHREPASGGTALAGLALFGVAAAAAALVGVLSSTTTAQEYMRLDQPPWAPPAWLFGPVWTVLYVTIAVAGWGVWRAHGWRGARLELSLFGAQLLLNAAWTPLFFAAGLRGTAFAEIVLLWAVLAATIAAFARRTPWAAALLVPYWAWTTFAAVLNFAVWQLNTGV
ncbi:TspO/MBR related protein [Murinocardiopsis flavida]|uniref:TspO/MBR related protein n=1 Tax=Murinocardiopsis flavida TaxID=645275 RepID=A0A2P8CWS6_9ACTN|nr:TspO/MBR family protein [Murinocardiopsis flavida]PSK89397.1 TspO/MBR related protein [Murinocardiopsis flavida]